MLTRSLQARNEIPTTRSASADPFRIVIAGASFSPCHRSCHSSAAASSHRNPASRTNEQSASVTPPRCLTVSHDSHTRAAFALRIKRGRPNRVELGRIEGTPGDVRAVTANPALGFDQCNACGLDDSRCTRVRKPGPTMRVRNGTSDDPQRQCGVLRSANFQIVRNRFRTGRPVLRAVVFAPADECIPTRPVTRHRGRFGQASPPLANVAGRYRAGCVSGRLGTGFEGEP